jgi:hypothetical protein
MKNDKLHVFLISIIKLVIIILFKIIDGERKR